MKPERVEGKGNDVRAVLWFMKLSWGSHQLTRRMQILLYIYNVNKQLSKWMADDESLLSLFQWKFTYKQREGETF